MTITKKYIDFYNLASKIIMDCNISFFPLNPLVIARKFNVQVLTYEHFQKQGLGTLKECFDISKDGFSFCYEGKFFVVYNQNIQNKGRRRFTITHELSHILLGHIDVNFNKTLSVYQKNQMEKEADMLTINFLAPLSIAHMCNINCEKEMSKVFGLSNEAGKNVYKMYFNLRKTRQLSKIHNIELSNHFTPFIFEHYYKKQLIV